MIKPHNKNSREAKVLWFTGLSGAGKSTIADTVKPLLEKEGLNILILDGDQIRKKINTHLGYSKEDIEKNNALIAGFAKEESLNYDIIIVSIISPYAHSRQNARNLIGDGFFEIWFSADLEVVIKRDTKGLYAKAKRNEITNMVGFSPSSPYEKPENPDFTVDTVNQDIEVSASQLFDFITVNQTLPQA